MKNTPAAIEAFAEAATRFCQVWSPSDAESRRVSLLHVAKLLADLNCRALELPEVRSDDHGNDAPFDDPDAKARIAARVPEFDLYWDIFDPLIAMADDPVANLLSDDLGDIYSDLKRGLALYENGRRSAAAWQWRFHFWNHWGEHLVGAQRAIYLYLRSRGE